jgi:hypothetical protein
VTSQLDLLNAELDTAQADAVAIHAAFSQLLADINLSRITTADAKAKFIQLIDRRQSLGCNYPGARGCERRQGLAHPDQMGPAASRGGEWSSVKVEMRKLSAEALPAALAIDCERL